MTNDYPDATRYLRRTSTANDGERRRLLASGRAIVLDRGHLAVDLPLHELERWQVDGLVDILRMHAVLANNPAATVARAGAIALHGLWTRGPLLSIDLVSKCRSSRRPRRLLGADGAPDRGPVVRRHHVQDLSDDAVTIIDGLPVTSLRRTVRDCLLHEPASTAILAAISAARQHAAVRDRWDTPRLRKARHFLEAAREDLHSLPRGYRGVRRALVLLAAADPAVESAGEALALVFARAIGLPQPEAQAHFHVKGQDYYGDLWFQELGLLGEYDGRQKYGNADDLVAEKIREDALRSVSQVRAVLRVIASDLATATARRRLESAVLAPLGVAERRGIVPDPDFGNPR